MDILKWLRIQWDRVLAWVAIVIGALVLFIGWLGVSDAVLPAGQIPYLISGGLGGVFLLGVGAMLWLSADLRDEWRQLHEIAELLDNAETSRTLGHSAFDIDGAPPLSSATPSPRPRRNKESEPLERRTG